MPRSPNGGEPTGLQPPMSPIQREAYKIVAILNMLHEELDLGMQCSFPSTKEYELCRSAADRVRKAAAYLVEGFDLWKFEGNIAEEQYKVVDEVTSILKWDMPS
jgi:hypothetical protein